MVDYCVIAVPTLIAAFGCLLEECDLVVLVLILMLVLVGRLPQELVAVKIDFTSFLIIYSSFTKLLYS
jgi:hypothetical protein